MLCQKNVEPLHGFISFDYCFPELGLKEFNSTELLLIQFSWDKLHWPQNFDFFGCWKKSPKRDPMILIEFQMIRPNESKIINIHKKSIGIWLQFPIYVSIFKPLVFYFLNFFYFLGFIWEKKNFLWRVFRIILIPYSLAEKLNKTAEHQIFPWAIEQPFKRFVVSICDWLMCSTDKE